MTNESIKLLNLIKENKTKNEICEELNINEKQLYIRLTNLKNKGFLLKRKYYSNGEFIYLPTKNYNNIRDINNNNSILFTSHDDLSLRCIAISDLHFGNSKQRLDLVNEIFNYSVNKNIHIILCCGDLIDGKFSQSKQNIKYAYKQMEYFIKCYPQEKDIITFGVVGDHDFSILKHPYHQNISEMIYNYRHDIVLPFDNEHFINIKNDQIMLCHKLPSHISDYPTLTLSGHIHTYKSKYEENHLTVSVPTISDINDHLPSTLELLINFENGFIKTITIKQLIFNKNVIPINEISYEFPLSKDIHGTKYEEPIKRIKLVKTT